MDIHKVIEGLKQIDAKIGEGQLTEWSSDNVYHELKKIETGQLIGWSSDNVYHELEKTGTQQLIGWSSDNVCYEFKQIGTEQYSYTKRDPLRKGRK